MAGCPGRRQPGGDPSPRRGTGLHLRHGSPPPHPQHLRCAPAALHCAAWEGRQPELKHGALLCLLHRCRNVPTTPRWWTSPHRPWSVTAGGARPGTSSPGYLCRGSAGGRAAHFIDAGIHAVPAVIIDRKHLVSGGQPVEVFGSRCGRSPRQNGLRAAMHLSRPVSLPGEILRAAGGRVGADRTARAAARSPLDGGGCRRPFPHRPGVAAANPGAGRAGRQWVVAAGARHAGNAGADADHRRSAAGRGVGERCPGTSLRPRS